MSLILAAARFAAAVHMGQRRAGTGRPYIEHPMRVAGMLTMRPDADESLVAAAWLHDVVEDRGVRLTVLSRDFGVEVAELVGAVTNEFTKARYPDLNRAERKRREFARLAEASHDAQVLKLHDRLDNLREGGLMPDFRRVYAAESVALADALCVADSRLAAAVRETAEAEVEA